MAGDELRQFKYVEIGCEFMYYVCHLEEVEKKEKAKLFVDL
jgi:hypothetical protein